MSDSDPDSESDRRAPAGRAEPDLRPRVVVFAYAEVGARCLALLLRRGVRVVGVVSHEDDPHEVQWFASVPDLARRHGIPLLQPRSARARSTVDAVRALAPDLVLSCYYRLLLPDEILALPRLGAFNVHGSLLPRYRGRAPVNWAILHGERETGATLHHMVSRADAGDVVDQEPVPIGPEDGAGEVALRVAAAAVTVLDRQLEALLAGRAPRRPQDERQATRFGRRGPEDGRIDWTAPSRRVVDLVRAVTRPFPGAFSDGPTGRLQVWKARACAGSGVPGTVLSNAPFRVATGDGAVELLDWTGAAAPPAGARLGDAPLGGARLGDAAPAGARPGDAR